MRPVTVDTVGIPPPPQGYQDFLVSADHSQEFQGIQGFLGIVVSPVSADSLGTDARDIQVTVETLDIQGSAEAGCLGILASPALPERPPLAVIQVSLVIAAIQVSVDYRVTQAFVATRGSLVTQVNRDIPAIADTLATRPPDTQASLEVVDQGIRASVVLERAGFQGSAVNPVTQDLAVLESQVIQDSLVSAVGQGLAGTPDFQRSADFQVNLDIQDIRVCQGSAGIPD